MYHNFKIIPTPEYKNKIFKKKSSNIQITKMIENILDIETKKGWEFVDIKTIIVPLKASFFKSSSEKKLSIIISKKKNDNSVLDKTKVFPQEDNYPNLGPALKD